MSDEEQEFVDTRRVIENPDGTKVHVGALIPANQFKAGNGSYAPFGSDVAKQRQAETRDRKAAAKLERIAVYEDKVGGVLEGIAKLQASIVELANDPSAEVDGKELQKLKLGLAASEQILNRVIGKPTTHIEANVQHGIAQAMQDALDSWDDPA